MSSINDMKRNLSTAHAIDTNRYMKWDVHWYKPNTEDNVPPWWALSSPAPIAFIIPLYTVPPCLQPVTGSGLLELGGLNGES
jgi:hypothetical protein